MREPLYEVWGFYEPEPPKKSLLERRIITVTGVNDVAARNRAKLHAVRSLTGDTYVGAYIKKVA